MDNETQYNITEEQRDRLASLASLTSHAFWAFILFGALMVSTFLFSLLSGRRDLVNVIGASTVAMWLALFLHNIFKSRLKELCEQIRGRSL